MIPLLDQSYAARNDLGCRNKFGRLTPLFYTIAMTVSDSMI